MIDKSEDQTAKQIVLRERFEAVFKSVGFFGVGRGRDGAMIRLEVDADDLKLTDAVEGRP